MLSAKQMVGIYLGMSLDIYKSVKFVSLNVNKYQDGPIRKNRLLHAQVNGNKYGVLSNAYHELNIEKAQSHMATGLLIGYWYWYYRK